MWTNFFWKVEDMAFDLRRVYATPFLESAGRLPLGQASKREEAGLLDLRRVYVTPFLERAGSS